MGRQQVCYQKRDSISIVFDKYGKIKDFKAAAITKLQLSDANVDAYKLREADVA